MLKLPNNPSPCNITSETTKLVAILPGTWQGNSVLQGWSKADMHIFYQLITMTWKITGLVCTGLVKNQKAKQQCSYKSEDLCQCLLFFMTFPKYIMIFYILIFFNHGYCATSRGGIALEPYVGQITILQIMPWDFSVIWMYPGQIWFAVSLFNF